MFRRIQIIFYQTYFGRSFRIQFEFYSVSFMVCNFQCKRVRSVYIFYAYNPHLLLFFPIPSPRLAYKFREKNNWRSIWPTHTSDRNHSHVRKKKVTPKRSKTMSIIIRHNLIITNYNDYDLLWFSTMKTLLIAFLFGNNSYRYEFYRY